VQAARSGAQNIAEGIRNMVDVVDAADSVDGVDKLGGEPPMPRSRPMARWC